MQKAIPTLSSWNNNLSSHAQYVVGTIDSYCIIDRMYVVCVTDRWLQIGTLFLYGMGGTHVRRGQCICHSNMPIFHNCRHHSVFQLKILRYNFCFYETVQNIVLVKLLWCGCQNNLWKLVIKIFDVHIPDQTKSWVLHPPMMSLYLLV